ncbi:MAG: NB-ARC domain-containing protein [Ferruginibacter sp.]
MVTGPGKQHDIFISYGRGDDIPFTEKLYADLAKQGYKVWFDEEKLESNGLSFLQSIRDSLVTNPMRMLLIVGPHASKSDYVRYEWEFALANCLVVIPILRMGNEKDENGIPKMSDKDLELIPQPIKKRNLDCINFRRERTYEEALKELLQDLSSPIIPLCRLYSVPNKPANFITRQNEIETIKEIIMGDNYKPGVISSAGKSTALAGMGGIGKSVLASAICHDCEVKRSFSDGVYWVTIGQQQPELNVTRAVQLLTGDDKINLRDNVEEAKNKLRETFKQKNCLIILDDVWKQQDINIFPSEEALRCRLLITTRNKQTVSNLAARIIEIGLLNKDDSLSLLARAASGSNERNRFTVETLPAEASLIIEECGHLPLAIDMAGGMISFGDPGKWKNVLRRLQQADLEKIKADFPEYGLYPNLFKVLEVSVEDLDDVAKKKYTQLAVFPKDAQLPGKILEKLWMEKGFDDLDTDDLLDDLVKRSLLRRTLDGNFTLHDLQIDYLKITCPDIKQLNIEFLDKLGRDPLKLTDEYAWKKYIWHLKEAGEIEAATQLLQRFEWIEAKLFATDINELLEDYEHFELDAGTNLIYGTLKLSSQVLVQNRNQIAAQLIGRLSGITNVIINQLISKAKYWRKDNLLWMYPKRRSLISPGNLIRTLVGHQAKISGLIVSDGKIISAGNDGTIRIWDIKNGKQTGKPLIGHKDKIDRLIVVDGKIISCSMDKTIRAWDIYTGKKIGEPLSGYESYRVQVFYVQEKIVCRKNDHTITVWDIKTSEHFDGFIKKQEDKINKLIVNEGKLISGSEDGVIQIWDFNSEKQIDKSISGNESGITALIVFNNKIISGANDGTIQIWDINSGMPVGKSFRNHEARISELIVCDHMIISGSIDGTIQILDLNTGMQIGKPLKGHSDNITRLIVSRGKIVAEFTDSTIQVFEIRTGNIICEPHTSISHDSGWTAWISSIIVSDDKIVFEYFENNPFYLVNISGVIIADLHTGEKIELKAGEIGGGQESRITRFVVSKGKIISGSTDGLIRIYDLSDGNQIGQPWKGHENSIGQLLVQDGKLISGSDDGTIRIWDLDAETQINDELKEHESTIGYLFSMDGKIISGSDDNTIRIWNGQNGELIGRPLNTGYISQLLIAGGIIFCTCSWSNMVGGGGSSHYTWEIATGIQINKKFDILFASSFSEIIAKDGLIISGSVDGTISVWNIETGNPIGEPMIGHKGCITHLIIENNKIISGSDDCTIRIWDINSRMPIGDPLTGHDKKITQITVCGNKIISGSADKTVRIWDIETGKPIGKPMMGSEEKITWLQVSNNKIMSGSGDGTIRIWDLINGNPIGKTWHGPPEGFTQLIFADPLIISASKDRTIRSWDINNQTTNILFEADAGITTMLIENNQIIAGDEIGKIHFLEPVGFNL